MSDNTQNQQESTNDVNIIRCPEGTHDVLPDDHEYLTLLKKVVRHRARQAGFRRITPPVFEHRNLFERAIGDGTDIVEKELFTFKSRSGKHEYALRPELTAGIVRSYIEHGMAFLPQPVQLYAFEQVFRYDRPQKNRYRQFYQFDMEVIGEKDPGIDAQLIHIAWQIFKDLKIDKNLIVRINSLGSIKERKKFIEDLQNYFEGRKRGLCEDCLKRLDVNPLRILDCKNEDCRLLAVKAPKMKMYLNDDDKEHFQDVLDLLKAVNIPYIEDDSLVRGLDYYCGTIFEIVDKTSEGSQISLLGGGGYDSLVEMLGGPANTPAIGFGMGVERVINRMKDFGVKTPSKDTIHVFVAQIGKQAKLKALPLIEDLQKLGFHTMGAVGKPSIKGQMKMADKFKVRYALIMGQIEVRDGKIILRDMTKGCQEIIPFEKAIPKLLELIGEENLDKTQFLKEIYLDNSSNS